MLGPGQTPHNQLAPAGKSGDSPLGLTDYLLKILNARVYDVAIESPLEEATRLSKRLSNAVWLKREDSQPSFSFKLRGAYNKMAHLTPEQLSRGVICASAGNHAQGVALSAHRLGCRAQIVMPVTTPKLKIEAVRAFHGEVTLHGESYTDAYSYATEMAAAQGLTFVHPFDDPDVIAGQGTIAMEILQQLQHPIHAIFCAIGGGGLISGVAAYVKAVRPEIKVIGVQIADSSAMVQSVAAGERVQLSEVGLFSDGTAVKLVGEETFRITQALVDEFVIVDNDSVCAAIKDVFEDTRSILEPAGALSVAGLKKYVAEKGTTDENLIAVTCGANMNFDRLRFVAERAEVGEQREALFAVTIPEKPGSFKRLCEILGARGITEFNYRMADNSQAHVFVGLTTSSRQDTAETIDKLNEHGFVAVDLTNDELSKMHVRYMVGGRSPHVLNERLYRFDFPERPGALMKFLSHMPPSWNISLFHYRSQGGDVGRILAGIQVPDSEMAGFEQFLSGLAYPCVDETDNPAYRLFLQ
ncbi:threonine ammonia-lyase, biosynthetic [Blastopirellula sp. JC732]|uniref:L-threonine dehydratase n=1 Tax=Blastopirellula sediminis TaxID=2894196 RepID=A0A9X1MHF0_9BACT|nr:threonine ammonia-lyase, biosynthetic [Blastopirellula sediminis]MCC9604306.1 threonine ammonia-lyase, biosynthetic [Blastopirellula sediminis]MCC9626826.1 threonine ammonia-lyase, biosynthetic [Blastopirellula sediminis]